MNGLGFWININQAALEAGVSRRTIYNWIKDKRLETKRTAGGAIRIYSSSLWKTDVQAKPTTS